MSAPQLDYERIKEYVENNLQTQRDRTRRGFFFAHVLIAVTLGIFVLVNAFIALTNPGVAGSEVIAPGTSLMLVILGVALLVGLFMHAASFVVTSRRGEAQMRERLTLKAVQLELARLGMSEMDYAANSARKRKRRPQDDLDRAVRLSDDG